MRFLVSVKSFIVPRAKSEKFFLHSDHSKETRPTREETSGNQGKRKCIKILNNNALLSRN